MDSTILLTADVILTAVIFYILFVMKGPRSKDVKVDNASLREAELTLRKSIDALESREKELLTKQEKLKKIIDRLDDALVDIQSPPSIEALSDGDYKAARNLLKTGEPIENVVKICNLTKGEADVLSSITSMAS